MFTIWTSHISDPEEKKRFENEIIGAKRVLERLAQIKKQEAEGLDAVERSVKQFDTPNWDYKNAYYSGAKAEHYSWQKLIDLDQQDITNDRKLTFYPDSANKR